MAQISSSQDAEEERKHSEYISSLSKPDPMNKKTKIESRWRVVMLKAFQTFDSDKKGYIESSKVSTILQMMNLNFDKEELTRSLIEHDPKSKNFCLYKFRHQALVT